MVFVYVFVLQSYQNSYFLILRHLHRLFLPVSVFFSFLFLVSYLKRKDLYGNLSDSNRIWTHNYLRTKLLWIRILLLSFKLPIWLMLWAQSFLAFRQTIDCRFTLKLVRDMIITDSMVTVWLLVPNNTFFGWLLQAWYIYIYISPYILTIFIVFPKLSSSSIWKNLLWNPFFQFLWSLCSCQYMLSTKVLFWV